MGFTNEEINIKALNQYNGNIGNAIGKILKQNNKWKYYSNQKY